MAYNPVPSFAEDSPHASGDRGIQILAVRKDTGAALAGADGDYAPIQVDATGRLYVNVATSALPSGAATSANQTTIIGHVDGIEAYLATVAGAVSGTEVQADVLSIIPGTGATNLGKAEDSAHASGDVGVFLLALRTDTLAASSGATGDYEGLHTDSIGALWARLSAEIADDAAFTVGTSRVLPVGFFADETATDSVNEGDIGAPRMTLDRKVVVTPQSHTAGGATPYKLISAATTNATSVKASAGQVYSIIATNVNAAVRYLKLYNKSSAPTVGTDTPVQVYALPGATTGGGFTLSIPVGMEFTTGIAFAITTGVADSDTGAVAANEIVVNLTYK